MPGITMWVMNTSEWMTEHWYMILGLIILVIAAYKMIYRTEQGRLAIDRVKMKMPLFGKLTVKTACAQFARTMSTLLSSGISTIDALETVSKIVNNIHYTNALLKAREEVMKGIPLSEPLTASKIFPPMVCHMTGIGEETGNIEDMLEKLADYYDEEVEMTTQSVLAAMEPLIIVFMAVVVGTLVVAVVHRLGLCTVDWIICNKSPGLRLGTAIKVSGETGCAVVWHRRLHSSHIHTLSMKRRDVKCSNGSRTKRKITKVSHL